MAIICLDQRAFRSPQLATAVAEGGHTFLLPDAALMEACKRHNWRKHIEPSMRLLAGCIDQVMAIQAHADCLRLERALGAPLNLIDMVDPIATKMIRAMLSAFASGDTEAWLERMTPLVEKANTTVTPQYLTHEKNLTLTMTIHSHILKRCSPKLLKALRRREDKRLLHRITTYTTSILLAQLAPRFDYTLARIEAELESPSYMIRSVWLKIFYIYDWISLGGIEQLAEERNSNDEIDRHYVIVASYADNFITMDDKAERAERGLRSALTEWELFSEQEAHWLQ